MQHKLHGGFHWTELYLGALLALLGVLGAALLYWEWAQHKRKKDLARTAENLRFNADANFLKRLIGQVRVCARALPGVCMPCCAAGPHPLRRRMALLVQRLPL